METKFSKLPRLCTTREFPASAYLPGQGLRPSPAECHVETWDGQAESLLVNAEFLWGIDLYNHGYYWEAHEAWEGLWMLARNESAARLLLQGLIQCAGAVLKTRVGQLEGCRRLSKKGLAKIEAVTDEACFRSLDLSSFARALRAFCAGDDESSEVPRLSLTR